MSSNVVEKKGIVKEKKKIGENKSELLYGIDDKPPMSIAILLAFQHIIAA